MNNCVHTNKKKRYDKVMTWIVLRSVSLKLFYSLESCKAKQKRYACLLVSYGLKERKRERWSGHHLVVRGRALMCAERRSFPSLVLTNIRIKTSKQKEFLLWRCHRFYLPHKEIKKKERSKEEILNGGTGIIYRNVKGRRRRNRQKRFWSIILLGRPPPTQNEKKKRRRKNVWSLLNLK